MKSLNHYILGKYNENQYNLTLNKLKYENYAQLRSINAPRIWKRKKEKNAFCHFNFILNFFKFSVEPKKSFFLKCPERDSKQNKIENFWDFQVQA